MTWTSAYLCPSNAGNAHLPAARELGAMKPGALLLDTARGNRIDMPTLCAALATGTPAGFAADVVYVEPSAPDDPLLGAENVLLTPHVASLTAATYRAHCLFTARNVVRVLRGEAPEGRATPR